MPVPLFIRRWIAMKLREAADEALRADYVRPHPLAWHRLANRAERWANPDAR